MSCDSLPMMPLFPGDWIMATRRMSLAERGAYFDLLCYQWEAGLLPAKPEQLARMLGVAADEFAVVWAGIKDKFTEVGGGLQNARLEEHRTKSLRIKGVRQTVGSAGGKATAKSRSFAEVLLPAKTQYPSPSPSPSVREEIPPPRAGAHTQDDIHAAFVAFQAAYPSFSGRKNWLATEAAYHLVLERGATPAQVLAGVARYRAYCDAGGVGNTAYVLSPAKFLGDADEPWKQLWEPPQAKAKPATNVVGWRPTEDEPAAAKGAA